VGVDAGFDVGAGAGAGDGDGGNGDGPLALEEWMLSTDELEQLLSMDMAA
jgi:hypothetical protein